MIPIRLTIGKHIFFLTDPYSAGRALRKNTGLFSTSAEFVTHSQPATLCNADLMECAALFAKERDSRIPTLK